MTNDENGKNGKPMPASALESQFLTAPIARVREPVAAA